MYHWIRLTNLETGSIIPRAHWGNGIRHSPLTHKNGTKEIIYEHIRENEFPDRPSRFESIFLCPNLDSALNFRQYRKNEVLYRVEIIDSGARRFLANWNMMPDRSAPYDEVERCAREYWRGGHIPEYVQEIIVESDVRAIERVDLRRARERQPQPAPGTA